MPLTGPPQTLRKLNPTRPYPKLWGSRRGRPWITGPGYPIEMRSYFQSLVIRFTSRTILSGVMVGPDGILRSSCRPVATLKYVPPTSITRILAAFLEASLITSSRHGRRRLDEAHY